MTAATEAPPVDLVAALEQARKAHPVRRPRAGATTPPPSEVVAYLARKPGRCSGCGHHLEAQGHGPGCMFGPRAWFTLEADGTWSHNPQPDAKPAAAKPAPVPAPAPAPALELQPLDDGSPCQHWTDPDGYCGSTRGVRHHLPGRRCPEHTPAALAGRPEAHGMDAPLVRPAHRSGKANMQRLDWPGR